MSIMLAMVREKHLEMNCFPGQMKVGELFDCSGKLGKHLKYQRLFRETWN